MSSRYVPSAKTTSALAVAPPACVPPGMTLQRMSSQQGARREMICSCTNVKPSFRKASALACSVPGGVRCGMWSSIFADGSGILLFTRIALAYGASNQPCRVVRGCKLEGRCSSSAPGGRVTILDACNRSHVWNDHATACTRPDVSLACAKDNSASMYTVNVKCR